MTSSRALPQVVVLAGGKATRLREHSTHIPKILVPVAGKPFLDYVLALLRDQGAVCVHFCLGYLAEHVITYLRNRRNDGLRCSWTVESRPLGTGGALRHAFSLLEEEFVLLLGDTYTPVDFAWVITEFRARGRKAAMTVLHNRDWLVPSNVRVESGAVTEYTKDGLVAGLEYVDYGIAVLRKDAVQELPPDTETDVGVLFQLHIAAGELAAIEMNERFYEIGSPEGLAEFERLVISAQDRQNKAAK